VRTGMGVATTTVATSVTNSATVTGLLPGTTYTFAVRAKDAAGLASGYSAMINATTAGTAAGCTAQYIQSSFTGGITVRLLFTNNTTTTWNGWTVSFVFVGGEVINGLWNAVATQQPDGTVNLTSVAWNATVQPGGTVDIGFNATVSAPTNPPTAISINGMACNLA
jgi:chitodextrinase